MPTTEWSFVGFPGADVKPHAIPAELEDGVVADMRARGPVGEVARKPTTRLGVDFGGVAIVGRPVTEMQVDGLTLAVPSDALEGFLRQLCELPERTTPDGARYFKLHGHWNCLVLTPAQRDQLLAAWSAALPAAIAAADDFYRRIARRG